MDKQKASTSPSKEELFNLQVPDDMTISFTPKQYGERLKKTREGLQLESAGSLPYRLSAGYPPA